MHKRYPLPLVSRTWMAEAGRGWRSTAEFPYKVGKLRPGESSDVPGHLGPQRLPPPLQSVSGVNVLGGHVLAIASLQRSHHTGPECFPSASGPECWVPHCCLAQGEHELMGSVLPGPGHLIISSSETGLLGDLRQIPSPPCLSFFTCTTDFLCCML